MDFYKSYEAKCIEKEYSLTKDFMICRHDLEKFQNKL